MKGAGAMGVQPQRGASSRFAYPTSQDETPVKDARSPKMLAHFGSPSPRCAAPSASLTVASPADARACPR